MNAPRARRIGKPGRMRKNTAGFLLAGALALAPQRAHADVDLRTQATRMLAAMEGDAHRVAVLLQTARAAHKPGPIKCVDGYLSRIDTDVRHGREDLADIRAALASGDVPAARRSLGWLTTRREAARQASFAADSCMTPTVATDRDQTTVHVVYTH